MYSVVSTGTGRAPGEYTVTGEVERLICNFYLSVEHVKLSEQIRP